MKRRGLLVASVAFVVFVLGAVAYGIASTHSPDTREISVSLADLKQAGVIKVDRAEDVFVVWDRGEVLALSADAQHVGDDVVFCESSRLFESPAHGEKFDIRGFYYAGPGARGLTRYPTRIEGDDVLIDLEHPTGGFDRGAGPPREPEGPFCVGG